PLTVEAVAVLRTKEFVEPSRELASTQRSPATSPVKPLMRKRSFDSRLAQREITFRCGQEKQTTWSALDFPPRFRLSCFSSRTAQRARPEGAKLGELLAGSA